MKRDNGVMEYWSIGVLEGHRRDSMAPPIHDSTTPPLHHSITPTPPISP